MNQFEQEILDFFESQLGKPYKFGAIGPNEWDCRGLDRKGARAAGLDSKVFPAFNTVHEMADWAKAHGCFRPANVTPEPGWFFLWGPAAGDHKPIKGNGHTGVVKAAPSAANPYGLAISAYAPGVGVIEHRLIPKPKNGHALYGYLVPQWPTGMLADPPLTEPETPPSAAAIDSPAPVADSPEVADLKQQLAVAEQAFRDATFDAATAESKLDAAKQHASAITSL